MGPYWKKLVWDRCSGRPIQSSISVGWAYGLKPLFHGLANMGSGGLRVGHMGPGPLPNPSDSSRYGPSPLLPGTSTESGVPQLEALRTPEITVLETLSGYP